MADKEKVVKGLEQFKADFKPFCGNNSDWSRVDDALALLKEQSDVVLCKDCKFYTDPQICPVFGMDRYYDWFCADGERREAE